MYSGQNRLGFCRTESSRRTRMAVELKVAVGVLAADRGHGISRRPMVARLKR